MKLHFILLVVAIAMLVASSAKASLENDNAVVKCSQSTFGAVSALTVDTNTAVNPYVDEGGGGSGPVIHQGDPCHWTQQGQYVIGIDRAGNIVFLSCNCYATPVIGLQCWWE